MLFKDISYLQRWQPFCLAEWNHLRNFTRGHYEEHFCEIILHLDQWFRRYGLIIFLIYSFGSNFDQWSGTVCAILEVGIMRNISVKLF